MSGTKRPPALPYKDAYRLRHYLPPAVPPQPLLYLPYPNRFSVSPKRAAELRAEWKAITSAFADRPDGGEP